LEQEAQQAYHWRRWLAGHTLNLLNAAVMLLYIHPELSFMECMRQAGNRLGQFAGEQEDTKEGTKSDSQPASASTTQEETGLDILDENAPAKSKSPEQQYYDNYKKLVDEYHGKRGDGDGGVCNHVIYMYDLPNEVQLDKNDKIQIDDGNTRNALNDCFEDIAKCVLCNRHQQKINEGDTQLHIYVPAINETTAATETASTGTTSTGTHGGMLKKPKQRKTRKHNQKKKKRTIRKNKQQHTKRSKRTSKKKSHKNSKKKSHKSQ
jgi:hypothetical protein